MKDMNTFRFFVKEYSEVMKNLVLKCILVTLSRIYYADEKY